MRNTAFALAMAQSYLRWLMQWLASDRLSVITLSSPAAWLAGAAGGAALTGLAGFSTTGAGAGAGAGLSTGAGAGADAAGGTAGAAAVPPSNTGSLMTSGFSAAGAGSGGTVGAGGLPARK